MEDNYITLGEDRLKYLMIYNYVKNHSQLKELAENLDILQIKQSGGIAEKSLQKVSKDVINEGNQLLNQYLTNQSLNIQQKLLPRKLTRIYMDGVFDIIHSGHFNAIRQSKKFGDILVVGVNSDADVEKAKGPTIMKIKERMALASACKWVDEVIADTPYSPTLELLDKLNIDYCAHGDDMPVDENGIGCYDEIKKAGRLRVFKRTEGISTTEIIGRLLQCTRSKSTTEIEPEKSMPISELLKQQTEPEFQHDPIMSNFLTTGWRLTEFCNDRVPKAGDKVVYIDGAFDILHVGHIETLQKAKELGDFLYVGVHDDSTINQHRGKNYPILNLQERVLNLLALKYVDDVVISCPWMITEDMIKSLKISLVVEGTNTKNDLDYQLDGENDAYIVPKKLGIYQQIESSHDLTSELLVKRLIENREKYIRKYQNKSKKESEYYQSKEYINEI